MASKKILKSTAEQPLLKLNLGSGQAPKEEGWVGIDIIETEQVDAVWDLRKTPWEINGKELKDNSVSEVRSSHFLEHLTGPERMVFFNELYRVLTPQMQNKIGEILVPLGKAQFIFPYYSSTRAIQDPLHMWPPLCEASFLYLNREWRNVNKLDHYPITCDFNFTYGHAWDMVWGQKNVETRQFANLHYNNVISDLIINLEPIKPIIIKE